MAIGSPRRHERMTQAHGWRAALLALLVLGCGGSSAEPEEETVSTAGDEDDLDFEIPEETEGGDAPGAQSAIALLGIHPPETPWAQMSHEEKEWDMIGRYQPIMNELFREQDAERWPNIGCEACHGDDADARGYEMPPPDRLAVPRSGTPEYAAFTAEHDPETIRFFEEEVVDVGGRLLGMEANFNCGWCHPRPE
jgi:hypothetical protein